MAPEHADLDEVILAYVEASESGRPPDRAAWLARYPDLADELTAFFDDQERFSTLVAPIRAEIPPPSSHGAHAVVLDAAPALAAGSVVGDYELLNELACGGMGVVYKARHRALGRVVALKMIRSGELALPEDVARLRLEAGAVALLDHPNIVPIYDVGEHEGQPYFTMKLVEGGSLATPHPDGGPRATRRSAARLVMTVARAVHHAHQRGILHRDLKPGNILIDRKGEPHVTDFGLATRLTPPSSSGSSMMTPPSLTQKGIAVGTPSYMAPEQASGPKKRITVAADVYSLGAVLYELLTGRPPFRGETPLETLVQVMELQPTPPRSLVPSLPRDLETICLKCLEKDPTRRYASAEALADDLQRLLAGEPILARATGPARRCLLWCRRSPGVALLATWLVLAVATGLVAVTVLWRQAEAHAHNAERLGKLYEDAMFRSDDEAEKAKAAQDRAETHRREAEESFLQAHQIVDRFCMRLSEERLSAYQGLQPLRKEMLEAGLEYYKEFVAKRGDDPALKADLARAHFRVAVLTNLIGSKRDALTSYAEALRTYEDLLAADPPNDSYREQIAVTCIERGGILEALNDKSAALTTYERARDLLEALDRARPGTAKLLAHLGVLYNNLGNVNRRLNRLNESRDSYEKALAVQERLIQKDPLNPNPQRELAVVYVNVAILDSQRGQKDDALRLYQKAREIQEKLFRDHPNDREVQHDLALTYRRIGERLVGDRQLQEGLHSLDDGHRLIQKLADANKSVTAYQWELALSHRAFGHAHKASGKKDDAIKSYHSAVDLLTQAHRLDPSDAAYTRDQAATWSDLATLLADDPSKLGETIHAHAKAVELYRELARPGTDVQALTNLSVSCFRLGIAYRDARRHADALAVFEEARDTRELLVRLQPDEAQRRNDVAAALFQMGRMQTFLKRSDDSIRSYQRAVEIGEQLVKEQPNNLSFRSDLGAALTNLGNCLAMASRIAEAQSALRRALAEKQYVFKAAPQSAEYRRGLNIAYGALAEVERKKGTPAAAAALLLERRDLWPNEPQELFRIACEQADTASRVGGGKSELSIAESAERSGYLDQAMETLRMAVKVGFTDAERLRKAPELASLQPREDFQSLLSGLKK
jgi:tetratricopeptide (TPR) repeat protein